MSDLLAELAAELAHESPPDTQQPYDGPVIAIPIYSGVSELELGLFVTVCRLCSGATPGNGGLGKVGAARTVNRSRASIVTAGGLVMTPHVLYAALPEVAGVLVPGGPGAQRASKDALLRPFLRSHAALPMAASGSGLLLCGEAGLLSDRTIGGPTSLEDTLWGYSPAHIQPGEVVQDGQFVSAPAGLAALQAALFVAGAVWGPEAAAQAAQRLGASPT